MTEYKNHPAANLFPLLSGEDAVALVTSMRRHGFDPASPIELWRGRIVDGRNRLAAAAEAGVEPVFRELPEDADPYLEAWKRNGARRHLEPDQRAAIVLQVLEKSEAWQKAQAKRQTKGRASRAKKMLGNNNAKGGNDCQDSPVSCDTGLSDVDQLRTRDVVAKQANVSPATVARVMKVQREAPERLPKVAAGKLKATQVLRGLAQEKRRAQRAERQLGAGVDGDGHLTPWATPRPAPEQPIDVARRAWQSLSDDDREALLAELGAVRLAKLEELQSERQSDREYSLLRRIHEPGKTTAAAGHMAAAVLDGGDAALALLGLKWSSTSDDVKRAYKAAALKLHPDKGGSPEAFNALTRARDVVLRWTESRDEQPTTAASCQN